MVISMEFKLFLKMSLMVLMILPQPNCGLIAPQNSKRTSVYTLNSSGSRLLSPRLIDESLLHSAAKKLGASPPWNAPRWLWTLAWKMQTVIQPLLHRWDECLPKDTFLNLAVLWWKSIAGNRIFSPTYDKNVAFDLLPDYTRRLVSFPLCYLFPNLHHQNVALRTLFIDSALREELAASRDADIVTVTLGAGFDTRCLRFLAEAAKQTSLHPPSMHELDLHSVVKQKLLLLKNRYLKRRPNAPVPNVRGTDLNDLEELASTLSDILAKWDSAGNGRTRKLVVMVEAVFMYVEDKNVLPILSTCVSEAKKRRAEMSFIFSDRFPGILEALQESGEGASDPDGEREQKLVRQFLGAAGMELVNWTPKPGRARHMGVARLQ